MLRDQIKLALIGLGIIVNPRNNPVRVKPQILKFGGCIDMRKAYKRWIYNKRDYTSM